MNKFELDIQALDAQRRKVSPNQQDESIRSVLAAGIRSTRQLVAAVADAAVDDELKSTLCWVMPHLSEQRGFLAALAGALKSGTASVRSMAALSLGQIKAKRSVLPHLLDAAAKDPDLWVRRIATHALGELGDRRAARFLIDILNDEQLDPGTRGEAAEALGEIMAPEAFDPLVAALDSAEAEVRFFAAFGLSGLRDLRAIPFLKKRAAVETAELPQWGSVKKEILSAVSAIRKSGRNPARSA